MQIGNFDEAKQVDFQKVSLQFDLVQHQVQIVSGDLRLAASLQLLPP